MHELEYVVALHQTEHNKGFKKGSIDASDVKAFLMSRYGISVTEEEVRKIIFKGLAGGDEESACIDIVEIVAIMIIPLLVKVSNGLKKEKQKALMDKILSDDEKKAIDDEKKANDDHLVDEQKRLEPPSTIIADVLKTILLDIAVDADDKSPSSRPDVFLKPPKLTPQLLKRILLELDEHEMMLNNDLIEEMISMASKGGDGETFLDVNTFARALTGDIKLYNIDNEIRFSTIFDDVFPEGFRKKENDAGRSIMETDEENSKKAESSSETTSDAQSRRAFSHIDFTADNILSWEHVCLIWLTIVFSYYFYVLSNGSSISFSCHEEHFGCLVADKIVKWLEIMLKLVILGTIVGSGLSLGNGNFTRSVFMPIIGLASTILFIFFPAFYNMDNFIFSTYKAEHGFEYILVVFGILLALIQIKNLVALLFDNTELLHKNRFLAGFLWGSSTKNAFRSKQAGIFKVNQLVRNAYKLHQVCTEKTEKGTKRYVSQELKRMTREKLKRDKSTKETALENYANIVDETESVGGIYWAWKEFATGSLQSHEGIWLSSRLIAASAIQFVLVVLFFVASIFLSNSIMSLLYPVVTVEYSADCFSEFDYEKCLFGVVSGVGICRDVTLKGGSECLDLFEEIPQGSTFAKENCKALDSAFESMAELVPSNLTCSEIFLSVEEILQGMALEETLQGITLEETLGESFYHICYELSKNYDLASNETLADCKRVKDYVSDTLSSGSGNITNDAVEFCMETYNTMNSTIPSMCDRKLYHSIQGIKTYEKNHTEDYFCQSMLSYCSPDPLNPTQGSCAIGMQNFLPFHFKGPSCRDYSEINSSLVFYDEKVAPLVKIFQDMYPEKWMIRVTSSVAITTATFISLATAIVYIPSSIHTVMKFRSGVIPSLRDPHFIQYRKSLESMTYLMGCMFWGLLSTTILITILVAGVVFLLVWQGTRKLLLFKLGPEVIGIGTTVVIKMALCKLFMKFTYAGYYRRNPALANIFCFALECWYIALTVTFIIARLVKFIVSASLYSGRIDRPILAEGLMLDLDILPKMFYMNLLSTESHRHPYIELLGKMYLLKLRHKDNFGTSSGAAWRMIFVTALMPWLKKRRISEERKISDDKFDGVDIADMIQEIVGGIAATTFAA